MAATLALWASFATSVVVWLVPAVPPVLQTPLISLSCHPGQRLAGQQWPREPSGLARAALAPHSPPVPARGVPGHRGCLWHSWSHRVSWGGVGQTHVLHELKGAAASPSGNGLAP